MTVRVLVVSPTSGVRARIAPHMLRVGWRIITGNGEPYDLMWGATTSENLDALVADVRKNNEHPVEVLRLDSADDLRDSHYYDSAAPSTAPQPGTR